MECLSAELPDLRLALSLKSKILVLASWPCMALALLSQHGLQALASGVTHRTEILYWVYGLGSGMAPSIV